MPLFAILVLAIVMAGALPATSQVAAPTPADLAARLQKRYEAIRDFTADFTQVYRGQLQRKTATERGKIQLKKPSRVRFTYESPERKVFVADGTHFYSYFQQERAGTIQPLPKEHEASTALMFLAGRGNIVRDFTASMPASSPAGEWQLQLVPKTPQADYQGLTLIVDRVSLALLGFVTIDDQGTNTVRFTNLRENTGLRDSAFAYSFPAGTQISR